MKYLSYILIVLFSLLATQCTDKFDEINIDPTAADSVDPGLLLTRIQLRMSQNRYEHWRAQYIYSSCIIQHNASSFGYWSGDKYNQIDSYSSAQWDHDYPNTVKNVVNMIHLTSQDPLRANFTAAARIVKVFIFHRLTDLYGDVPYSEAGKGFIESNFFPAYDTQESIYNDFFKELDEAVAQFDDGAIPLGGDVWLNNDIDRWKKFANSLRLRLAFRLIKVDPTKAQSEAEKAVAGGVFTSTDESAFIIHTGVETNGNSDVMAADDNFRLSETFVNYLKSTSDPRIRIWGMTYDGDGNEQRDVSTWKGLPNGTDGNSPEFEIYEEFVRHNRSTIKSPESPMLHLMYSEVALRMAEMATRGWNVQGSAAEHFENGLRAACEQVNLYPNADISEDEIAAFISANPLSGGLEQINTELWASFYQNAIEAFANWRSSGFPELVPVDHQIGTTNGTIPRRLYYPTSELGLNPNYEIAVDRQFGGTDDLTGRVWWDN